MSYYDEENLSLRREVTPQSQLTQWIENELRQRDWRPADLAKAVGVRDSTISRILNGTSRAGPELCNALAEALDISPVDVFRMAELLPPSVVTMDELSMREVKLIQDYRSLPPEHQEALGNVASGLASRFGQSEG